MANTYTQIHLQIVFSVKYRLSAISEKWDSDLYKYISSIVTNNNHKMLSINGTSDHIHFLVGLNTTQSVSDLVRDIKANSSKWINDNHLTDGLFEWQEGYGAFSYSKSQIPQVAKYIENQKEHHKHISFLDEYKDFLQKFGIEYKLKYIFQDVQ